MSVYQRVIDWLARRTLARLRRNNESLPPLVVTIETDVSRFLAAIDQAREIEARARFRRRIAHERSLGQAYVGTLLDGLCRDLGLDPVDVWRQPREREERDRRDQAALSARAYFGATIPTPEALMWPRIDPGSLA